jgi:hypothetical protein
MSDQPETLTINIVEEIKIKDVPPGGGAPKQAPSDENK